MRRIPSSAYVSYSNKSGIRRIVFDAYVKITTEIEQKISNQIEFECLKQFFNKWKMDAVGRVRSAFHALTITYKNSSLDSQVMVTAI